MNVPLGSMSWMRISSANDPAITISSRPTKKYWNPMTLWSSEKTYLRMKPWAADGLLVVGAVIGVGTRRGFHLYPT